MQKESQKKKETKLGFILLTGPTGPRFAHALQLVESSLAQSVDTYAYLIHEGVGGAADPKWKPLVKQGLKLFACAYSARQRNIPLQDPATWVGLTVLNDLLVECDKTVTF